MNDSLWLDPTISLRLCLTLLHSLWQLLLLAAIAWLADRVWRRSVERRYVVHVAALLAGLVALPVTFALVDVTADAKVVAAPPGTSSLNQTAVETSIPRPSISGGTFSAGQTVSATAPIGAAPPPATVAADNMPTSGVASWNAAARWIAALYALGVLIMLARLANGLSAAHRQMAGATRLSAGPVVDIVSAVARNWSLRVVPAVGIAEKIVVPQVVGLLRPMILLPASALSGLSADELQMIVAHELAHVRRHDLWINLVQRLAETVLFFNPALWYLTRRISTLREFCCDELTCRTLSSSGPAPRTRYAAALLRVAELSCPTQAAGSELAALAATGRSPSELRRRIAHLFGEPIREPLRLSRGSLLLIVAGIALLLAGPAFWQSNADSADQPKSTAESTKDSGDDQLHVSGTCTTEDGEPISSAELRLYHREFPAYEVTLLQTVRTGHDGSFRFQDVAYPTVRGRHAFAGSYAVTTGAEGRNSAIRFLTPGKTEAMVFRLKPGATLQGKVTGRDSRPIVGADVWIQGIGLGPLDGVLSAKTDGDGHYEIRDAEPWKAGDDDSSDPATGTGISVRARYFRIRHAEYGTQIGQFTKTPSAVDVALAPAAIVEGRVIIAETGEPATGVLVRACSQNDIANAIGSELARTGDDGRYRMALPESTYNLWTHHKDLTVRAIEGLVVKSGNIHTAPDLALIKGGVIEGQLIAANSGEALTLRDDDVAYVTIRGPARPTSSGAVQVEPINPDGSFRFRLPAGSHELALPHSSFGSFELKDMKTSNGRVLVDIADGETSNVRLKVVRVAKDGRPSADIQSGKDAGVQASAATAQTITTEASGALQAKSDQIDEKAHANINISVMDANGGSAIPEFRVIAGVSSGGGASEFETRTGKTVINWQPHTCHVGKDGGYVWPLDKAYDEMALRVEADGYQPQIFTGFKKANGAQHIDVLLSEDEGVAGRVLTPVGEPAAAALVALAIPHQAIVWEDGKVRGADDPLPAKPGDRWRRPRFFRTDETGRFRLPTEIEPAAVLVIHESGVLELAYDTWKQSSEVTLQRWGGIAGQLLWQDKPGVDEEVSLTVHRDEYGYPGMIASYATTRTGQDGKFRFDRVLPGLVQISRPIVPAEPNATGITAVILNGMFQHVKVAPGDPAPVLLGGRGRTVTGKFVGLDSWDAATYHFHPEAPHIGFDGDGVSWKAFGQFKASAIGPLLFRDKQPINEDGAFTIEKMLPGRYQLFLSAPGFKNYAASAQVQIDPEVPGEVPAPIELKEIATVKQPAAAVPPTDNPPEKPPIKATTIRGKVLDDATGEPVGRLIIQGGKFDQTDPEKVTWGFSESSSSARDGSFSTTIRWADGWTARILADGYIPQPVITSAPPADNDEIEVVIRLKRGPIVRGVVLDHAGQPVKGAAIFAVGPTGVNLPELRAGFVPTGTDGRFELPIGEAKSLAVSHPGLEAWAAEIPTEGEVTIRLPEPARVDLELAIDGADKESVIFYQLLTQDRTEFTGVQLTRDVKIANPGKLSLTALPPGRYQLCRNVMNRLEEIGEGAMLEREFFELKAGETKSIRLVRDTGARVRGKVTWPQETKLMGTIISVRSMVDQKSPFDNREWPVVYASQVAAEDGSFLTERMQPGKYFLIAEGYTPLANEQRFRTGVIGPSYRAQMMIEVPADGELKVDDLVLKSSQAGE